MHWHEAGGLWVSVRAEHQRLAVRVCGDLDLFTADSMRRQVCASIAFHGIVDVDVDLSECTFLDTAGVHVLLQLRNALSRRGGQLTVGALSPTTRRVLEGTGQHQLFAMQPPEPDTAHAGAGA